MDQINGASHDSLDLQPVSRWPTRLPESTVRAVLARPVPQIDAPPGAATANGQSNELTSIVVVTFDNLVFTRLCLESVLTNTLDAQYELIVVDNGSTDGSAEYLRRLNVRNPHVRTVFNERNRGFAAANNQGLERAVGARLILLNNDTIVSPFWLPRLLRHLDPGVGMVSPVTNRSGNEAEVDVAYGTYGTFLRFAGERYHSHRGESSDISSLVMFCAAMRRDVWEEIGPLDERFEVGMFEDDDYAMRLRSGGYRLICAEDTFIHHFGQATIGKLSATGEYGRRFHANRERWEMKWARHWQPHHRRPNPEYESLVRRIRTAARSAIPAGAEVAVLSNGDDGLVDLEPCRAVHFPCDEDGVYAGHHPRDSREAIAQLEAIRGQGAGYLIVPRTASWWLDYYAGFRRHLEREYRLLALDPDTCAVFALSPASGKAISREEHPVA